MLTNYAIADEVLTYLERIRFNCLFIAMGKNTPWPTESQPPEPDANAEDLNQPLGMVRVETLSPVYPTSDEEPDFRAGATPYKILHNPSPDRVVSYGAFKVYCAATVRHKDLTFNSFRELGLINVEHTLPGLDLEANRIFHPSQIINYNLEVYDTFPPIQVQPPAKQTVGLIRPFD